ncbi:FeS-binding protein [Polaribacter reichenbachii]|uniref:FeS-binding protein n=1 Tax=Polaribacter reichenbachii TaxID=996801 RepID=A0A1B8TVW2_9FLAO|nr:4Fe-4S binding protein [Polaribacter reichenbachii]APZ45287.1 FeS-binding protein [Polaribacter reichenbachii]AUC19149.1 FeS-binding protein [Polaribacter reichenbachii]OBY63694.1 FeS-binding protein [Polaribacter reichenbachii]
MKFIKHTGLVIFLIGLFIFTASIFTGNFSLTQQELDTYITEKGYKSEIIKQELTKAIVDKNLNIFEFSTQARNAFEASNNYYDALIAKYNSEKNWTKKGEQYQYKIFGKPHTLSYEIAKKAGSGFVKENSGLLWFLTFGLGIIGALLFILPNLILLGKPGIKNDGIYLESSTNRGWIAWLVLVYLVVFYLVLYFRPDYVVNWTFILDPISKALNGGPASQWFVYGFLYCTIMLVMGVRMYIKYRHNKYQIIRTTSVLFFQIVFAFLIPEIMTSLNMPGYDFKNAFPLDYDFFFEWNLKSLTKSGGIGIFILVWGIVLTLVIVPVMVYFFGKRWYCSWVCGCGGLAETLGDPYRQHSNKSLNAWKLERWLIHSVLAFSLLMTIVTLYCYFSGTSSFLGINSQWIKDTYSFLIGAWFAGVIGTGFYPIFGNRVWCRFGCPLAAYLGMVQRFKSRFRITTNGGQCISCGNCSTYCEQGIDVRAYAQKGENIVRSSCVGCGICSAVCPRGVLKLENGPEEGRINPTDVLLGNDVDLMKLINKK